MKNTNAKEANDARPVGPSKQSHVLSAALAFCASEKVSNSLMGSNGVAKSGKQPISEGAEERTVSPVATLGADVFRLMVEGAVVEGYIKPESVEHIMAAYSQVGR